MPIKFRCPNCRQFLGISRAKAGTLTDCPTCGHSIRVPSLDGSVAPMPEPELNFEDAGLAKALDVLAQLDGGEFSTTQGGAVAVKAAPPPTVASAAPVPAATPVRETAAVLDRPAPRPVPPASATPPVRSRGMEAAIQELNAVVEATPSRSARRGQIAAPGRQVDMRTALGLAGGGLLLGALGGFLIGRASVATVSSAVAPIPAAVPAAQDGNAKVAPAPPAATVVPAVTGAAEFRPALTGRLTYTNENGESRADEGARVLVFPEARQGSGKLPSVGFLAGAGEADFRLSKASLRAIGGDYAVADSDGRYEIALPAAGGYQVLVISRYQDQKDAPVLENSLRKTLESYFDRPNRVIGQVRYHFDSFHFNGESPTTKGHGFTR